MKKASNFLTYLLLLSILGSCTTSKISSGRSQAAVLKYKDVNQSTLDEIVAEAELKNKIIFIDFYTTWCGPCKWMDSNVLNQNSVVSKLNRNFVNYKVDAEDFEGVNTALKYRVAAYPTYIFVTPTGTVLHRLEGMIPQESFEQVIDEVLSEKHL